MTSTPVMPDASRSRSERIVARARAAIDRARAAARRSPRATARAVRSLGSEQRVAGAAAILLILSTLGPLSWIEAAEVTVALGVLYLLKKRADRAPFHLPFGDGVTVAAAGVWAAVLVVLRVPARPLGQSLLALACAAVLVGAGLRERAKRPPDDLPVWDFPPREAPTEVAVGRRRP